MKVALLFDHFGPYHLARFRGAVNTALDVVGVEFYSRSRDYAWGPTYTGGLHIETVSNRAEISKIEFQAALRTLLDKLKPDVVTIPGWAGCEALCALEWCLKHKVPAIMMSESCAHDEIRSPWKEWVKRRIVSCCSTALAGGRLHEAYLKELGLNQEQISLGYDAVDNDYFTSALNSKEKAENSGQNLFLASARFIEKKNLPRLLNAYAFYRQTALASGVPVGRLWSLILLGDGELRQTLEQQVDALSLRDYVSMPGFLQYQDLPAYYQKASAFIHASTTEQWGLVVNEAMASGLPVIVSNRCGCAPDLVREGVNGFTFDPNDTEALAKLMLRMTVLSDTERASMGRMSLERVSQWGPERFGQGLRMAAENALSMGVPSVGGFDRALIKILSSR